MSHHRWGGQAQQLFDDNGAPSAGFRKQSMGWSDTQRFHLFHVSDPHLLGLIVCIIRSYDGTATWPIRDNAPDAWALIVNDFTPRSSHVDLNTKTRKSTQGVLISPLAARVPSLPFSFSIFGQKRERQRGMKRRIFIRRLHTDVDRWQTLTNRIKKIRKRKTEYCS